MLFKSQSTNTFKKLKYNTLSRKLPTPSYRNILRKQVLIFSSVEADLLFTKIKIKKIERCGNPNRKRGG
jgi:hypothetical protein